VPSGVTDDIFAGIEPGGVPFHRVSPSPEPQNTRPALLIGDPWAYYHNFWHAHGLDHLADIAPSEVTVKVGGGLIVPLIIDNPLDKSIDVNLSVQSPAGWEVQPVDAVLVVPHMRYFLRIQAAAPKNKVAGWQNFTVAAKAGGEDIGKICIRAELSTDWVAPQ
jgi:hypothetical protein